MPAWALRLASLVTTLLVLGGSWSYASTHVKNPNAPLLPPLPSTAAVPPTPSPGPPVTAVPSLLPNRPGLRRPTGSTGPTLTLQPSVQETALPKITITHVS